MTCTTSVKDYCTANGCDQTLTIAEQDKTLCPASEIVCGQFNVVMKAGADTTTSFFYQAGALVAIERTMPQIGHACVAGPVSFTALYCASGTRSLPACAGSDPPPTGW